MKIKSFHDDILWFWISKSIGKTNTFADFIIQKVINVSCSQYITPPRSKNSAGRSIVSVAPTNNEGKGGVRNVEQSCRLLISLRHFIQFVKRLLHSAHST